MTWRNVGPFVVLVAFWLGIWLCVWLRTNYKCSVVVKSCNCGAHWWIRRWYFFWRHLDASPFNDQLQNRWTIWMFEFRRVLKLTPAELEEMGYPHGPVWPQGFGEKADKRMWTRSKWQLSPRSESYCARCALPR